MTDTVPHPFVPQVVAWRHGGVKSPALRSEASDRPLGCVAGRALRSATRGRQRWFRLVPMFLSGRSGVIKVSRKQSSGLSR